MGAGPFRIADGAEEVTRDDRPLTSEGRNDHRPPMTDDGRPLKEDVSRRTADGGEEGVLMVGLVADQR